MPPTYLLKRTVVELPFVVFALLLPFVATGPQTEVLGVSVSEHGLEAGIALLIKGTLGVLASLTLAATTEPQDLLVGLERLRLPQQLVQIMAFMVRYLDVVTGEMQRMKDRPRVPRLHRPQPAALAGPGPLRRRAVHPLLRARRAGPPRDAVARLHRQDAPVMTR